MDATYTDWPIGLNAASSGFDEAAVFNAPNQFVGEMGQMKRLVDVNDLIYVNVPANTVWDQIKEKLDENAAYEIVKSEYEALATAYDAKLNEKWAQDVSFVSYIFPDPSVPVITVPATPDRPPQPEQYTWLNLPNTITGTTNEVLPDPTKGGWGAETAGMLAATIDGKSFGLVGPSANVMGVDGDGNDIIETPAAAQGVLSSTVEMSAGCLPKYMAVTVLPKSNTAFTQSGS